METLQEKKQNNFYLVSFIGLLGWMFAGSILFIIPLIVQIVYQNPSIQFDVDYIMSDRFLVQSMILEVISKILPIVLILFFGRKIFVADWHKTKKHFLLVGAVLIIGAATLVLSNYLLEYLYQLLGIEGTSSNQLILEQALESPLKPVMIAMIVIIAPFFEEIVFRKLLIHVAIHKFRLKRWIAIFISIFFFAFIHVMADPASFVFLPQYLVLSTIITMAYILTKENIHASIGLHFLNNLLAVLL